MFMRVGIKVEDGRFNNLDLSKPEEGNPGVGGTTFEELLLSETLAKNSNFEVVVYHTNASNKYSSNVIERLVNSIYDIPRYVKQDRVDILVFATGKNKIWYQRIIDENIACIAWCHGFLNYYELKFIRNCNNIKRVIFVGREMYNIYIADDIIRKSTYIYNMFHANGIVRDEKYLPQVVYMGALNKDKGFHILAKAWPIIKKNVPRAELIVIGSGRLYGRNTKLGKYNVATPEYEKKFIPYLLKNNKIDDHVSFLGIVGDNKQDILKSCSVGVVNPSGKTETFCISAVEIEAVGIPVCTTGKFGLLDTVINNKTGLFSNTSRQLAFNIVELLNDANHNTQMGNAAIDYVKKFEPKIIIKDWEKNLTNVYQGNAPQYINPDSGHSHIPGYKRLLRYLRFNKGMTFIPSGIILENLLLGMPYIWMRDIVKHFFVKPQMVND